MAHVAEAIAQDTDMTMTDAFVSHSSVSEWKFDTGSSAHMTNNIGQYESLTPYNGVGGNSMLQSKGVGTIVRNASRSPIRLHDVLYVPDLGHFLLSWNKIKNKFCLSAHGTNMVVTTVDNAPIFDIEFRGGFANINK